MRRLLSILVVVIFGASALAQNFPAEKSDEVRNINRYRSSSISRKDLPLNPALKPFYHGVASGDPLPDKVIIWTRVTPDTGNNGPIPVSYRVATDTGLQNVITQGTAQAIADRDYCVKIDVGGLQPGTTYYYGFTANGVNSLTGRTRTAPTGSVDHLRFVVASCQNYEAGYFNAYARIADRNDLDAVIHLGDYIYEYGKGVYGAGIAGRENQPAKETVELADYRTRYSLYRLDPNLMRAHQQHPFITVWDDHESANDAYKDGAQNHQPSTEGDWNVRKAVSQRVYSEWMPIRDQSTAANIRRLISYGNLAELYMLDTRLEARDKQGTQFDGPDVNSPTRTMLGQPQRSALLDYLKNSRAKWKLIGQQVMFAHFNVGFGAGFNDGSPDITNIDSIRVVENIFLDIWDGYPVERDSILSFIEQNRIDNTIILSGDFHCSFAFDVARQPVVYPNPVASNLPTPSPFYTPSTGQGSLAVEFLTPSITSANFDENVGRLAATVFQQNINSPINVGPPLGTVNYNPHLKFVDLMNHGYYLLDIKGDTAKANYYFAEKILEPFLNESFASGPFTVSGTNRLQGSNSPSTGKTKQEIPAPLFPPGTGGGTGVLTGNQSPLVPLQLFPNPAIDDVILSYSLNVRADLRIAIADINGREIKLLQAASEQDKGVYTLQFKVNELPAGHYFISLQGKNYRQSVKFTVRR